eukprot:CAMPEP_0185589172 /NCGR_PEP_ID=MMETSP0434-20130131/55894_1 /TAXON_ID=626734 ORGANISM="Favella taraikaensis, Strain Fe Narragansett Bay" /NCGR_SAMPLE_ID=MMETSP0434 /ASSEMBLY_ACC=CAM_ASM_000379 /LENGTH=99 /DNA_ID=CAMNT_0028212343 /DNA_START=942 /DNA_END=1241 /DNA_ORIENTATION=+
MVLEDGKRATFLITTLVELLDDLGEDGLLRALSHSHTHFQVLIALVDSMYLCKLVLDAAEEQSWRDAIYKGEMSLAVARIGLVVATEESEELIERHIQF